MEEKEQKQTTTAAAAVTAGDDYRKRHPHRPDQPCPYCGCPYVDDHTFDCQLGPLADRIRHIEDGLAQSLKRIEALEKHLLMQHGALTALKHEVFPIT